jgi:NTP pyrophosphatase (non-canonical NTP hydrolase)
MNIIPIKTREQYYTYTKYLDSLYGVELDEIQTNEVLIIQQLLEHYEQNNLSKVGEDFDTTEDLDYIYELIQNVSSLEKFGLLERVCKLQEEVGELSAEVLKQIGFKSHDLTLDKIRENILLESVDCLIMSLDILSQQGFSKKEIIDKANSQIEKWISNIKIN